MFKRKESNWLCTLKKKSSWAEKSDLFCGITATCSCRCLRDVQTLPFKPDSFLTTYEARILQAPGVREIKKEDSGWPSGERYTNPLKWHALLFFGGGAFWVFIAAHELSLVAASGGYSLLRCAGFSLRWPLLLQSPGSSSCAHGLSSCGVQAQ